MTLMVSYLKVCTTCNTQITTQYVEFKCPKCADEHMTRCDHCRSISKEYKCPKCGFEGP